MSTARRSRKAEQPAAPAGERQRPQGHYDTRTKGTTAASGQHKALKDFQEQKQLPDPFKGYYAGGVAGGALDELSIIQPPYNPNALIRLPKENFILRQCVDALVTNTVGHGYRLAYKGPDGGEESPAAIAERDLLKSFLDYPNEDMSLIEVMERVKADKETIGFGVYEIGRDTSKNITTVHHAPAHTFRRTVKDADTVDVNIELPRGDKTIKQKAKKRFCRWVQIVGNRKVYFKEFGDPRIISSKTGKAQGTPTNDNTSNSGAYVVPADEVASEILVDALYYPGEAYGVPRWLGQMPSVLGSRESELTNLDYFKENAVPAMAVLVAGGLIPQSTLDEIENTFSSVRGRKATNRVVVIEAEGDHRAASVDGTMPVPKIEIKMLGADRQKDGQFKEYQDGCMDNIRSAFRLPSLFTGHAKDYTFASAKTSLEVADGQVFGPERNKNDDLVNYRFLAQFKPKFWAFRLQPPRITDPEEVIRALKNFDGIGAMTPNIAIEMVNEYFDLTIAKVKETWGNYPFSLVEILATQGRLKGIDDVADEMEPLVTAAGPGGNPDAGPIPGSASSEDKPSPAKGKGKGKGKTPPVAEKRQLMQAVADNLLALRAVIREQREAEPEAEKEAA